MHDWVSPRSAPFPSCDHHALAVVGQSSLFTQSRVHCGCTLPSPPLFEDLQAAQSWSGRSFPQATASLSRLWASEKETWPFPKTSLQGLITSTPGTQEMWVFISGEPRAEDSC